MKHNFSFTFQVDPLPTPRPRVARFGGVYYPKKYQDYKSELERQAKLLMIEPTGDDYDVEIKFYFPKPRKTIKVRPTGDLDNLAKGVLDALSGHVFETDDQVMSLTLRKEWVATVIGWIEVTIR